MIINIMLIKNNTLNIADVFVNLPSFCAHTNTIVKNRIIADTIFAIKHIFVIFHPRF